MKDRIKRILHNPPLYDPVYKVVQRLFTSDSSHNLQRTNDEKHIIRRRAWRRFILGYPPRKKDDTSTGDSLNWEWIVSCVHRTNHDVVIVSRDSDYGITLDGTSYANDWLAQELKSRVNQQRRIHLHTRLTEALREFEIAVSKEEEEEEQQVISQPTESPISVEDVKARLERIRDGLRFLEETAKEQFHAPPSKTDVT